MQYERGVEHNEVSAKANTEWIRSGAKVADNELRVCVVPPHTHIHRPLTIFLTEGDV
jgi:hypothetical protein